MSIAETDAGSLLESDTLDPTTRDRQILNALRAAADGDFSVRLPNEWLRMDGKIADAFNALVIQNQRLAGELGRVTREVGREGRTRQRVAFSGLSGQWRTMEESVNNLIDDLVRPTAEVTRAIG